MLDGEVIEKVLDLVFLGGEENFELGQALLEGQKIVPVFKKIALREKDVLKAKFQKIEETIISLDSSREHIYNLQLFNNCDESKNIDLILKIIEEKNDKRKELMKNAESIVNFVSYLQKKEHN